MLFWLVLHSLQLSGAETADAGFSGEKWTLSCWNRTSPNKLKIHGGYFPEEWRSFTEKEPEGGHQVPRRPPGAAPPRPRRVAAWTPGATPGSPLWPIYPSSSENPREREFTEFRRRSVAETYREEKTFPAGRFRRGEHLPEGGDHRHHHHHHHGHHRDHHQHHLHHQHHPHLHPISSHHCNLCCNSHYSSPLLYRCWLLLCGECY